MHSILWLAAVALIALAGCGSHAPAGTPPAPAAHPAQPTQPAGPPQGADAPVEMATPPFTAAQIRDATQVGRTYRFAMRQGEQTITITMRFTAVTPEHATLERTIVDAQGKTVEQASEDSTWEQLVGHASYPADATTITETKVEVPAGSFDATLYTVVGEQEGKPFVSKMYFARSLPGAPVKTEITIDGKPMLSMELLEHVPGQ
jgi:predicted small lipoprotein YifL